LPSVEVVLRGFSFVSSEGNFAPCAVLLVRATAPDGSPRTVLYDAAHVGRRQKLEAALGRRGVALGDVDTLVLSHAHWDHVQNADMFPNARVLMHADELTYAAAPHPADHATPGWTGALLSSVNAQPCVDGDELCPGVRVMHLPGHTPGSVGLAVDTADGLAVISGDALASATATDGTCPNVFWDAAQADDSIGRIVSQATVVYPGHDRPFLVNQGGTPGYLTEIRPVQVGVGSIAPGDFTISANERGPRRLYGHAAERAAAPAQ
jgi:N-acyl homoserine lactone hydrolase